MPIRNTTQAAELFAKLEGATADLAEVGKRDLGFLHTQPLDGPFEDVQIRYAEATSFDVYREDFQDDGILSLRVGVKLSLQSPTGENFGVEEGVLWATTDGDEIELELAEISGAQTVDSDLKDLEPLLSRLG